VISTTVGFTGGAKPNPTYEEVSTHETGHCEAIEVVFDPARTNYRKILDVYWKNIDPTAVDRQFADQGSQYRTVVFYRGEKQKQLALESKKALAQSGRYGGKPIVTKIEPASAFYPAEDYHQKFYLKNQMHYQLYHEASGRDSFFRRIWGEKSDSP
jgi:methionine-S-sulfoxide reductase